MRLEIEKFDRINHQYYCDGREIPSVTRILDTNKFYTNIDKNVLANAAAKGSMLHQDVAYYLETGDTMNEPLLDNLAVTIDKIKLYIGNIIDNEISLAAEVKGMQYAGTIDIVTDTAVIEIKSNMTNKKLYWLQLAGYSILAKENSIAKPKNFIILYVKNNNWDYAIATGRELKEYEKVFMLHLQKFYLQEQIDKYFNTL